MKKGVKITLIVATVCLVLGMILCTIALALVSFDVRQLSTASPYSLSTYKAERNDTHTISFEGLNESVSVVPGYSDVFEIEYYTNGEMKLLIEEGDGVLVLREHREPLQMIPVFNIPTGERGILIKVPASFSGSFDLSTRQGYIAMHGVTASSMKVDVSEGALSIDNVTVDGSMKVGCGSGVISLYNVVARAVEVTGTFGSLTGEDVIAKDRIEAQVLGGGISMKRLNAPQVTLVSTSGAIEASLVVATTFFLKTSTTGWAVVDEISADDIILKTEAGGIDAQVIGSENQYRITTANTEGTIRAPRGGGVDAQKSAALETVSGMITVEFR